MNNQSNLFVLSFIDGFRLSLNIESIQVDLPGICEYVQAETSTFWGLHWFSMISNATETNHGFILLEEQAIHLTVCESKIDFFFLRPLCPNRGCVVYYLAPNFTLFEMWLRKTCYSMIAPVCNYHVTATIDSYCIRGIQAAGTWTQPSKTSDEISLWINHLNTVIQAISY